MGQFSRNLMVIAFLERTYCVPSSAMCAGHTSPDIELQGEIQAADRGTYLAAFDGTAVRAATANMEGVSEMK